LGKKGEAMTEHNRTRPPVPFAEFDSGILYHGDALSVLKTLPDGAADACITSPPYWQPTTGIPVFNGQLGNAQTMTRYTDALSEILREVVRVIAGGRLILVMGENLPGIVFRTVQALSAECALNGSGIWVYDQRGQWRFDHLLVFGGSGTAFPGVFAMPQRYIDGSSYPALPLLLVRAFVGQVTGTVLDPFIGTGTVAEVCKEQGRNWIGIDIDQAMCSLASERVAL
jgi:hypothetical protein